MVKVYTIPLDEGHRLWVSWEPANKRWVGNVQSYKSGAFIFTTIEAPTKETCIALTAMKYGQYTEGAI